MDELNDVRMLTVEQATEVLGVSRSHLYVLGREQGLPMRRLGNRTLVRAKDLATWLDKQKVLTPSEIGRPKKADAKENDHAQEAEGDLPSASTAATDAEQG